MNNAGEYGDNITPGCRVELHPGLDLWMRGARFARVLNVGETIAVVALDHLGVKRWQSIPLDRLRRID